jgi:PBP1b-binding outer membrane lipoprotein LpoB
MLKLIAYTLLILLFSGCAKYTPQVTANDKAKLISEEIIDNARCSSFKNSINSSSIDYGAIDKIYNEATKAHCIHEDI